MSALVLLHGFTGGPSSWDAVIARLPRRGLVLRPTLVGHHGGPPADDRTSWASEVARLAEIVSAAGPATLAGYSLGARLALAVALERPEAIERLVLVAPSLGLEGEPARDERRRADDALAASVRRDGIEAFIGRWEALPIFESQRSLDPDIRAAHRARRLAHPPEGLSRALSTLSKGRMPFLEPQLGGLRPETVALAGEIDDAAAAAARRIEALAPRARAVVVPEAGHDLCLEAPAAVAAAIAPEAARNPRDARDEMEERR